MIAEGCLDLTSSHYCFPGTGASAGMGGSKSSTDKKRTPQPLGAQAAISQSGAILAGKVDVGW